MIQERKNIRILLIFLLLWTINQQKRWNVKYWRKFSIFLFDIISFYEKRRKQEIFFTSLSLIFSNFLHTGEEKKRKVFTSNFSVHLENLIIIFHILVASFIMSSEKEMRYENDEDDLGKRGRGGKKFVGWWTEVD